MLQNIKEIYGDRLAAQDGDIGHVRDFYFDDKSWVIRYLVAETGSWLGGRRVLISPHALGRHDPGGRILHVDLTRRQIEASPPVESHLPVSRQYEIQYYRHYGWPAYWEGTGLWGVHSYPVLLPASPDHVVTLQPVAHRDQLHLRSMKDVTGYPIETVDDELIGHVRDFLVSSRSWAVREVVVETGHWYAGKEILIPPARVEGISHQEKKVFVNLTKADLQQTGDHQIARAGG